jgi:hypothetical protein
VLPECDFSCGHNSSNGDLLGVADINLIAGIKLTVVCLV